MVDANDFKLSAEIEDALNTITEGMDVTCSVKFNDEDEESSGYKIAIHGLSEEEEGSAYDDTIFYYCDSVKGFRSLLVPGVEDFVVTGFEDANGVWHDVPQGDNKEGV